MNDCSNQIQGLLGYDLRSDLVLCMGEDRRGERKKQTKKKRERKRKTER